MNTVRFYRGEESSVVHETYKERNNSIFAKQYERALNAIGRFLDIRAQTNVHSTPNNIFAFIGDRGMGKTSCMESVANMIQVSRKDKETFNTIDTVDPSFFDENRNILEMILGKMFSSFSKDVNDISKIRPNDYESKKASLLSSFCEVRDTIAMMESTDAIRANDNVTKLIDLASSSMLPVSFHKLVSDYLKYFDNDILIIKVDDIDLNTAQADKMVEQLRKYLIQDNVIILMAVKLSQLSLVMEQHFTSQYQVLRRNKRIEQSSLLDMVIKYLTKLIPLDHRIFMPSIESYFDAELKLYENRSSNIPLLKGSSVKYTVTTLIFKKCRYLFYHSQGITSPIVPSNLRDLSHLIEMLYRMSNYRESWDNYNKEIFRNYLLDTWMPDNLKTEDCKIINELFSIKDASIINSTVIRSLITKFKLEPASYASMAEIKIKDTELNEFASILNMENSTFNLSVGDVFVCLAWVKRIVTERYDRAFIFMIETLYSMLLYHYYDEMTESEQRFIANPIDEKIKKLEKIDGLNNYEILAAGSLINTTWYNTLSYERTSGYSRGIREILLMPLRQNIVELQSIEGELNVEQIKKLQLVEFFALHISRLYESKSQSTDSKYRTSKDLYYLAEFGDRTERVIFDLNSIFTNLCNIERTYKRVDENLYNIAKSQPQSILNQLCDKVKNERSPEDDSEGELRHQMLSWAMIRNAEILENFSEYISKASLIMRSSSNNTETFAKYYKYITDYSICTYDRENNEKPYEINFKFMEILTNALSGFEENAFNAVFSPGSLPFIVDDIMKYFKAGKQYKKQGVLSAISTACKHLFRQRSDLKLKMKEVFVEDTYIYNDIRTILEQFKNDNNL